MALLNLTFQVLFQIVQTSWHSSVAWMETREVFGWDGRFWSPAGFSLDVAFPPLLVRARTTAGSFGQLYLFFWSECCSADVGNLEAKTQRKQYQTHVIGHLFDLPGAGNSMLWLRRATWNCDLFFLIDINSHTCSLVSLGESIEDNSICWKMTAKTCFYKSASNIHWSTIEENPRDTGSPLSLPCLCLLECIRHEFWGGERYRWAERPRVAWKWKCKPLALSFLGDQGHIWGGFLVWADSCVSGNALLVEGQVGGRKERRSSGFGSLNRRGCVAVLSQCLAHY